jgi:hypothetical protein
MFAMLFDVCTILYNPFGPRDIDISHETVSRGIRFLAKTLASAEQEEGSGYPQTMAPVDEEIPADIARHLSQIDLGHMMNEGKRNTLLPSFHMPRESANSVRQRTKTAL